MRGENVLNYTLLLNYFIKVEKFKYFSHEFRNSVLYQEIHHKTKYFIIKLFEGTSMYCLQKNKNQIENTVSNVVYWYTVLFYY